MNITGSEPKRVSADDLVKDLLGLDPSALATLKPEGHQKNDATLLGLQEMLRRAFSIALQLRDKKDAVMRLKSESAARAHGWPDAATANLATLLAWSLTREWRWYQGLPFLALENAQSKLPDRPLRPDRRIARLSLSALIKELMAAPVSKRGPRDSTEQYPFSIAALVRETFRIDPALLVARFSDQLTRTAPVYKDNPDGQTRLGLDHLICDAISQWRILSERNIYDIQLLSDEDATIAGRPNARLANLITLLSAALIADDRHPVSFEAPRPRPAEEDELLRAAARYVYLDYSLEALDGLERLCDGRKFFGWFRRHTRAQRLLHAVAKDAGFERMPFIVAVQEHGLKAFEDLGFVVQVVTPT